MTIDEFVIFSIGNLVSASDGRTILCSADSVTGVSAQMLARTRTVQGDWSVKTEGGLTRWSRRVSGAGVLFS